MFKVRFTADGINFYNSEFERLCDAKNFAASSVAEGYRGLSGAVVYDSSEAPIYVAVNFSGEVKFFDN